MVRTICHRKNRPAFILTTTKFYQKLPASWKTGSNSEFYAKFELVKPATGHFMEEYEEKKIFFVNLFFEKLQRGFGNKNVNNSKNHLQNL